MLKLLRCRRRLRRFPLWSCLWRHPRRCHWRRPWRYSRMFHWRRCRSCLRLWFRHFRWFRGWCYSWFRRYHSWFRSWFRQYRSWFRRHPVILRRKRRWTCCLRRHSYSHRKSLPCRSLHLNQKTPKVPQLPVNSANRPSLLPSVPRLRRVRRSHRQKTVRQDPPVRPAPANHSAALPVPVRFLPW